MKHHGNWNGNRSTEEGPLKMMPFSSCFQFGWLKRFSLLRRYQNLSKNFCPEFSFSKIHTASLSGTIPNLNFKFQTAIHVSNNAGDLSLSSVTSFRRLTNVTKYISLSLHRKRLIADEYRQSMSFGPDESLNYILWWAQKKFELSAPHSRPIITYTLIVKEVNLPLDNAIRKNNVGAKMKEISILNRS